MNVKRILMEYKISKFQKLVSTTYTDHSKIIVNDEKRILMNNKYQNSKPIISTTYAKICLLYTSRSSSLDNQRRLPVTEAQQDDRAEPNEAVSGLQADASNGVIHNDCLLYTSRCV